MAYTLDDFWVRRFQGLVRPAALLTLVGWSTEPQSNPSFVEADLDLRQDMSGLECPIWFIAAPGAVGKSTLVREISARTGAVYLDLATANTVAGYSLSGGLDRNGLSGAWERGETTVLIDALDEARMRVSEESFRDFLHDVAEKTRNRSMPAVLVGRMGIVEEARAILLYQGLECPVFDIQFFDQPRAARFVLAVLNRLAFLPAYDGLASRLATHPQVYRKAADNFVNALTIATGPDDSQFAGYAPVLEAVAHVLAGETNPVKVVEVPDALQQQTLQVLTQRILEREAGKLREQLRSVVPDTVRQTLYAPAEQLMRLQSRIFGTAEPAMPAGLPQSLTAVYEHAFRTLIEQHPFLHGDQKRASGVVFDAVITAHALLSSPPDVAAVAAQHAGQAPQTANPFLVRFYLRELEVIGTDASFVKPEHVVLLYESMEARAGLNQTVQLTVEGNDNDDAADFEILNVDAGIEDPSHRVIDRISLHTTQAGELRFGRHVSRVTVGAPQIDVVIGSGRQVEMNAPVSMNVARLTFNCPELVVLGSEKHRGDGEGTVILEADELRESKVTRVPLVREGATLVVSWPGASKYPWSSFQATGDGLLDEPDIHDALHSIRRLVMAFRSHSRGQLARFKDKIEHVRMTKGALGEAIRMRLLQDDVLSLRGDMYFLDPDRLGQVVGATYQDMKLRHFTEQVRAYAAAIVRHR